MESMENLQTPTHLTFDAYNTLVNFDTESTIMSLLGERLHQIDDPEAFLATCSEHEFNEVQADVYRPYSDILRSSLRRSMEAYGLTYRDEDGDYLINMIPHYGPYPDVPPVLRKLRQHCKLVLISNTEDHLIAGNVARLGAEVDYVITAEQARAYKPSLDAFHYMYEKIGIRPEETVHIAQGFGYDIIPAARLGIRRIWINRRHQQGDYKTFGPYDEVSDMKPVPGLLGFE